MDIIDILSSSNHTISILVLTLCSINIGINFAILYSGIGNEINGLLLLLFVGLTIMQATRLSSEMKHVQYIMLIEEKPK